MSVPTVFVSAATVDLLEWRNLVADCLRHGEIHSYVQIDSLPVASSGLRDNLVATIDKSDYVFHLAGHGYGDSAGTPFPQAPQFECSWTQFEYYYAAEKKKPIFAFVLGPELSEVGFKERAPTAKQRKRLAALQEQHRKRVRAGTFDDTPLAGLTLPDPPPRRLNQEAKDKKEFLTGLSSVISQLARDKSEWTEHFEKANAYLREKLEEIHRDVKENLRVSRSTNWMSKTSIAFLVAILTGVCALVLMSIFGPGGSTDKVINHPGKNTIVQEARKADGNQTFENVETGNTAEAKPQPGELARFPKRPGEANDASSGTSGKMPPAGLPPELESAFARFEEVDRPDRMQERLEAGRELIRLGPNHPRTWYLYGYASFWAGKSMPADGSSAERDTLLREAVRAAKKGLDLIDPKGIWTGLRSSLQSNLSGALSETGQAEEAEISARKALEYDKMDESAWENLAYAVSLQKAGVERQLETLRDARKAMPGSIRIRKILVSAMEARISTPGLELAAAEALLDELQSLGEDPLTIAVRKAFLLSLQRKRAETEAALNDAVKAADTPLKKAFAGILNYKLLKPPPALPGVDTTAPDGLKRALAPYELVIERALQEKADDEFALALAALYYGMTGDAAKARHYSSLVPGNSAYAVIAMLAEIDAATTGISRLAEETRDMPEAMVLAAGQEKIAAFTKELAAIAGRNDAPELKALALFIKATLTLLGEEKWVELQIAAEAELLMAQNPAHKATAHQYLAIAQLRLKDSKNSVKNFAAAYALYPGLQNGESLYGAALAEEERYADAEIQFNERVERDPGDRQAKRNLAVCLAKQDKFTEAITILETLQHGTPPVDDPASDAPALLSAFLYQQGQQMMNDPNSQSVETRLKVEPLLARAYRLAPDAERKHIAGDLRLENLLSLSKMPEQRKALDTLLQELRSDPEFEQTCAMLAATEGWVLYLDAKDGGLENQTPAQLKVIHEKLERAFYTPTVRAIWQMADWHVRILLGEGAAVFEMMEKQLDPVTGKVPPDKLVWVINELTPLYWLLIEPSPGEINKTIVTALRGHLEKIIELGAGTDEKLTSKGWSMLATLRRLEEDFHAAGEANKEALALDPTLYNDWISLSDSQLRELKLWPAARSSIMAFRHFPWSRRSEYSALLPMTGNILMALSPLWLTVGVWLAVRLLRKRRKPTLLRKGTS